MTGPYSPTVADLNRKHWRRWMLQFLRALYESDGNALRATASVEPSRGTIYTHKDRCPLFAALWSWVLSFKGLSRSQRCRWAAVFPGQLPVDLRSGLAAIAVLPPRRGKSKATRGR